MEDMTALMAKAARGDETAFEAIVRETENTVYRYLFSLLHNREDALDASQETYLRLWRTRSSYRGDCAVGTWILRIAHNCAVDHLRAAGKRASLPLAVTDNEGTETLTDPPDTDTDSNPEEALARKEKRQAVRAAIDSLNAEQRQIIILRDYDGRSYEEIATLLGIEQGTVKSRLNRARNFIRKFLISGNFF